VFTGLVEVLGRVEEVVKEEAGRRLTLTWPGLSDSLKIGESIAVNGCCLTIVAHKGERFEVQAGPETLHRTNLGEQQPGDRVNLERALRVGDRLGGHFVQGHIDDTATLQERRPEGEWEFLSFTLKPDWTLGTEGIDRRRRRQSHARRRRGRQLLRDADPAHPGRYDARTDQARRPGQYRDRFPG
jgi:riboflavin synthase